MKSTIGSRLMLWTLLPGLSLVVQAKADEIGTAFTYQGRLEKPAGTSVTDTCDFRFGLWNAAAGGSQVAASPQTVADVSVNGGLFTAPIDFGPDAFDGSARWLAVEVQCSGDLGFMALEPRVELTPAPHALRAVEAAALDLPYASTKSTSPPMLELTQTGDGPAAIFKVQPQPEPPLPQPAVEVETNTSAPAIKATNTGTGPAATFFGNVEVEGEVRVEYAPAVFNRAVPIAYATINDDGSVAAGTPNVSAAYEAANQRYVITIAGEPYSSTAYVTTVTPITTASPEALFTTTGSGSGQLRIRIMSSSTGTTGLQRPFQFITYKP